MRTASQLLTELMDIIGEQSSWKEEVRFNWLRGMGRNFVFFANPEVAFEYNKLSENEFLMPQGISSITQYFENDDLEDKDKIDEIKKVLLDKGYDGENEGYSWKRTKRTHEVYSCLARSIAGYEMESATAHIPVIK